MRPADDLALWLETRIAALSPLFGLWPLTTQVELVMDLGENEASVYWSGNGSAVHACLWTFERQDRTPTDWDALICHELAERRIVEYAPAIDETAREALADIFAQAVVAARR